MFIVNLIILFVLFFALGVSAEFVVKNIKYLAGVLKIRLFAFGILLGVITTLPELSVGINAGLSGVSGLSVGNILGGVIVMLGLVLGCALILNRSIDTNGDLKLLLPQVAIILPPIFLGLDGKYGQIDGLIMIACYFGLIYYLYRTHPTLDKVGLVLIEKNKILISVFFALLGTVGVLIISHWIVGITLNLLKDWRVNEMIIGVLFFSIGTNLPEITIAFTAWRKKTSELSLSHLLSSAFTNILVLGILALISPIVVMTGFSFWVLSAFLVIILALFTLFYYTDNKLDFKEGLALLVCYLLFVVINVLVVF